MKVLFRVVVLVGLSLSSYAQQLTLAQMYAKIDNSFPDNVAGKISAAQMRARFKDLALYFFQTGTPDGQPFTRSQARAISAPSNDAKFNLLFITDKGLEGSFVYDAADNSTADDGVLTLVSASGRRYKRIYDVAKISWFGAKGDGINDDGPAFVKAIQSGLTVRVPKTNAYYRINNRVVISNKTGFEIQATGAKILNSDTTKASFLFQNCSDFTIQGGVWGYAFIPKQNGGNDQHIMHIDQCQNVVLRKAELRYGPEMGLAITNCNNVTVEGNYIHHTFRDGVYSRYNANLYILNNLVRHIKDDGLSIHDKDNRDPGVDASKAILRSYGYSQTSNVTLQGNDISNVYQGVGSIAAYNLQILNNTIKNTVIAGIAVFNINNDDPATASNIRIESNSLDSTNRTTLINGKLYSNSGQSGTGRAAIATISLGNNNQIGQGETKRLKNIAVLNNTVKNSGAHGFFGRTFDGLTLSKNTFQDCAGPNPSTTLSGDVIEIGEGTDYDETNNTVIDTRSTPLHHYAFSLNNVIGQYNTSFVRGTTAGERQTLNAAPTSDRVKYGIVGTSATNVNTSGATSFNAVQTPNIYQIAGGAWNTSISAPTALATAGNLHVSVSNDAITQEAFDYLGNKAWRVLNGYHSSNNWSEWTYALKPLIKSAVPTTDEVPVNNSRVVVNPGTWVRYYVNLGGQLWYSQMTTN
ncbi:right-handed parallel beta-helix repeat-containing protein [Spirosoma oryzicola]|uniref:right-handed parallel beta-helix repeat-containing protein n=1 Tax=Spirosoma oryzicola TaxID=2898794 RepID=UPI001E3610F4|nr:right-handed parallel beta-helix repeat-containing protein [Spirosoma oryzicola]UHG93274.1 right-handed parallel beta-helix repeat-containing protein [Spirosoma oryzicola]